MMCLNVDIAIYGNLFLHNLLIKYVTRCLKVVPKEDIVGLSKINIYEDMPAHISKDYRGMYYPNSSKRESAVIDIYLHLFIFYKFTSNKYLDFFNRIREKIYIMLFGKIFIEDTLLHEIGHHKYNNMSFNGNGKSLDKEEEYAIEYGKKYLNVRHPLLNLYYTPANIIYRLLQKIRINKAIEVVDSVQTDSLAYYNNEANLLFKKEEYEKAIELYNKALDIDNKCSNAYYYRGLSKAYLDNDIDAIADLTSAIDLGMNGYEVYYNRGVFYYNIGKLDEAINDLSQAIVLNFPHYDVYEARSICYGKKGDYARQNADMQEAIKRGYNLSG